jgi:hypothetical protein
LVGFFEVLRAGLGSAFSSAELERLFVFRVDGPGSVALVARRLVVLPVMVLILTGCFFGEALLTIAKCGTEGSPPDTVRANARPPRRAPSEIAVLYDAPPQPYLLIGTLVSTSTETQLQQFAAEVGGDALIMKKREHLGGRGYISTRYCSVADVIRFSEER